MVLARSGNVLSNVLTGAVEGDALPEISADDVDRFVSQSAAYFRFLAI